MSDGTLIVTATATEANDLDFQHHMRDAAERTGYPTPIEFAGINQPQYGHQYDDVLFHNCMPDLRDDRYYRLACRTRSIPTTTNQIRFWLKRQQKATP